MLMFGVWNRTHGVQGRRRMRQGLKSTSCRLLLLARASWRCGGLAGPVTQTVDDVRSLGTHDKRCQTAQRRVAQRSHRVTVSYSTARPTMDTFAPLSLLVGEWGWLLLDETERPLWLTAPLHLLLLPNARLYYTMPVYMHCISNGVAT